MARSELKQFDPEKEFEEDMAAEVMNVMNEDSSEFDPDLLDATASVDDPAVGTDSQADVSGETEKTAEPTAKTEKSKEEVAADKAKESDLLQSEYTNPVAKILDMLAKVFGDQSMVGNFLTSVAAKMEKTTNPVIQEEVAINSDAGAAAKAAVMGFTMSSNSEAVVGSLVNAGEDVQIGNIKNAVALGAESSPETTANAMLRFNNESMIHIGRYGVDPADPEAEVSEDVLATREQATAGLAQTNASMVEKFYLERMKDEKAGKPLSEETKASMAQFMDMEGIKVDYEHWYPGVNVMEAQTEEQALVATEKHIAGVTPDEVKTENVFENGVVVRDVGNLAEAGDNSVNHNAIVASVKSLAAEDPIATADSILEYDVSCSKAIAEYNPSGVPEEKRIVTQARAQNGLISSKGAMVEGYYAYAMDFERSGQAIPEDVQMKLDAMSQMDSVEVDYQHWYPGCDVRVPLGADAADVAVMKHEKALEYQGDFQNDSLDAAAKAHPDVMEDWKDQAVIDFQEDNYGEIVDSPTAVAQSVKTARRNFAENLSADVDDQDAAPTRNEALASDYMTMGAGIQTYYDTSKELIATSNLPADVKAEKQLQLEGAMRSQVTEFYESAAYDDQSLGQPVFTDGQKEMIEFNIPGVNVAFKDFKPGMNISSGEMPSTEVEPIEEMSVEEMARVDQKNPSDLEMEGFGYEVTSHESQATQRKDSVFVDTPSTSKTLQDQPQSRTGEAQRKSEPAPAPASATREAERPVPAVETKTPGKDRGKQAEELFGNIGGGKGKSGEFEF